MLNSIEFTNSKVLNYQVSCVMIHDSTHEWVTSRNPKAKPAPTIVVIITILFGLHGTNLTIMPEETAF